MSRPTNAAISPRDGRSSRRVAIVVLIAIAAASLAYLGVRATAVGPPTSPSLQRAVTIDNIVQHLRELDAIAHSSGNSRFTGTRGYERSVDYVASVLQGAGLDVEKHTFAFDSFEQRSPTVLRIIGGETFEDGVDMKAMMYSGADEVIAPIVPVAFERDPETADGPACRPDAFGEHPVNAAVVVVRPGPCLYRDQVRNAARAGAAAVIFVLPSTDDDAGPLRPTLFTPDGITIPVLAVRDEVGLQLVAAEGSRVRLSTDVSSERAEADNLIAETRGGDDDRVVMVGAHLDSVFDGPGINDNGSGSATVLEVARQMSRHSTRNTVRFAFWGGEEMGLLGSSAYVRALSGTERSAIAAYLNFDMVGSPNYVRFVYESEEAPSGSSEITRLFFDHLDDRLLVAEQLDLQGRSDHGPFIQAGIPVGGLFTGAEDPKTPEQAGLYGGAEGAAHDACYHLACDTLSNVNRSVLDEMADAIAHLVAALANRDEPLRDGGS